MNTGRASGTGVGTPRRTGISQRKDHSPRPTVRTPARDRAAVAGSPRANETEQQQRWFSRYLIGPLAIELARLSKR
jgi:hypothetical protein